jgi:hypothetical protein
MSESGPGATLDERVESRRRRFRLYVLLDLNRWILTAALTVGLFLFLLVLGALDASPLPLTLQQGGAAKTVFRAYIGAVITGVTLVVTLGQVVLSEDLVPLSSQHDRMTGAMEFRRTVEKFFGTTSPSEPNEFLRRFVETSADRVRTLSQEVADNENAELRDEIDRLRADIEESADTVDDELKEAGFNAYRVIRAVLDYSYSWKIYRARQIRNEYGDSLTDDEQEALDDVIDVLELFAASREYFKILYIRQEFVNLSQTILYLAVPALGVTVAAFIYLNGGSFPGATFGIDNLIWIFSAALAFVSMPFLLLTAYFLRIATMMKRTLALGPFILRESERGE